MTRVKEMTVGKFLDRIKVKGLKLTSVDIENDEEFADILNENIIGYDIFEEDSCAHLYLKTGGKVVIINA